MADRCLGVDIVANCAHPLGLRPGATALAVGGDRLDDLDATLADAGIADGVEVEVRQLSWTGQLLRWAGL